MAGNVSKTIMQQVFDVLPKASPGLSYTDINTQVGAWSPITIKHAVRQLRQEGLVEREGTENSARFFRAAHD